MDISFSRLIHKRHLPRAGHTGEKEIYTEIDSFYLLHRATSMPYSTADKLIRHVTLRQLQIFEAVVRLEGYTRAGNALHLTQPTISMQIKKLSEAIGLPLLEQVGRHVLPTSAGRDVYITALNILGNMVELGDSASKLDGVVKGEVNIAVITTAKYFMPHLLGAFIERHPHVQPRLTVTNRAKVLERLKTNGDDLVIMGQVPNELAVNARPFIDNELVVAAPPGHPLSSMRNITLEQLSKERFLVREPGSGTRQTVDRLFAEQGVTITPYMELGSSEAIKQGVMAGLGISVLSRHNLRLELAGNYLAILDVEGFPLKRRWYAVHLKGKKLSLAAQTFLDFIIDEGAAVLSSISKIQG
jgi:DNA-binding transcriptional LysR family regulator